MQKVPLPTDNIYKFFALFGLIILIFSIVSLIYITKQTNSELIDIAIQLDNASTTNMSDKTKVLIEGYRQVIVTDRDGYKVLLKGLALFGTGLTFMGFGIWLFKIQPNQDKLLDYQIERERLELEKLNSP